MDRLRLDTTHLTPTHFPTLELIWSKFGAPRFGRARVSIHRLVSNYASRLKIQIMRSNSNFQSVLRTHCSITVRLPPFCFEIYYFQLPFYHPPSSDSLTCHSCSCPWGFYELLYELNFPINPTFVSLTQTLSNHLVENVFCKSQPERASNLLSAQLWYLMTSDVWGVDIWLGVVSSRLHVNA